uniref:Uncharacterized protein n=1 Tax=Anguilla anguilla TaxID=7936 RepID=A0A0E9QG49_ANGAN
MLFNFKLIYILMQSLCAIYRFAIYRTSHTI